MQDRKFVLVPLCEIAPQVRHPILGKTCRELLQALQHNKMVEHLAGWEEVQWG
jgi:7,8-dihydro-6-hydroxymethylpterin-pyrophosphokinase